MLSYKGGCATEIIVFGQIITYIHIHLRMLMYMYILKKMTFAGWISGLYVEAVPLKF